MLWLSLFIVAAVGVAAWLGVRNMPMPSVPAASDSADAAATEQAHATTPPTKRTSPRRRERVRSAVTGESPVDTKASDAGAEILGNNTSASDSEGPAVVKVAETLASSPEPSFETLPDDNFVYSNEGGEVIAPRLVSLGFAQPLVTGFRARTSTLELVVSKSGTVERARISSMQRNWEDAMLLSRAKTFQFVPAQRNGHAVRYRLVMHVDTTP